MGHQCCFGVDICEFQCAQPGKGTTNAIVLQVRSIYRMIEFTQGAGGYFLTHEWTFYIFEAVVMLPTIVIFNVWHPAHYVSSIGFRQKRGAENIASDVESVDGVALNQRPNVASQGSRQV